MLKNKKKVVSFFVIILSFLQITATDKKTKIIGLIPARNEAIIIAQCLKALALYTDAIVYLDDASEDNSLEIVKNISEECHIERIITKTLWYRDEPADRNMLLQAGREIGGTHFIVLDSDEMLSANCLEHNYLKNKILKLQPGDKLLLKWTQLWRSPYQYRNDNSVWSNSFGDFIFCDDGICSYNSDFIHTPRSPKTNGSFFKLDQNYTVLHFQFVNWRNLCVKQAWYRCLEHIRHPQKSIKDINAKYACSINEDNIHVSPAPKDWYYKANFFDPALFNKPEQWRERQILRWFEQYTKEYFTELEIWNINWGKK